MPFILLMSFFCHQTPISQIADGRKFAFPINQFGLDFRPQYRLRVVIVSKRSNVSEVLHYVKLLSYNDCPFRWSFFNFFLVLGSRIDVLVGCVCNCRHFLPPYQSASSSQSCHGMFVAFEQYVPPNCVRLGLFNSYYENCRKKGAAWKIGRTK